MKVALGLDSVLSDIDMQLLVWREHLEVQGYPFTTKSILGSEDFWATMKPFGDTIEFAQFLVQEKIPYIILTERPKRLRYLTQNWLGRMGFASAKVIYSTIKRYDCRLNNADIIIDIDFTHLDFYSFENIKTVKLDRKNGFGLMEALHG